MRLPRPRPGYPAPYSVQLFLGFAGMGALAGLGFGSLLGLHPFPDARGLAIAGLIAAAGLLVAAGVMLVYSVFGKRYDREVRLPWRRRRDG